MLRVISIPAMIPPPPSNEWIVVIHCSFFFFCFYAIGRILANPLICMFEDISKIRGCSIFE